MHYEKVYPPSIEMTVQLSHQLQIHEQRPILSVRFEGCSGGEDHDMPKFEIILPIGMPNCTYMATLLYHYNIIMHNNYYNNMANTAI